jgi:glutathione synthase/RimK-type ligase-like ATP-grasp enzyme
MTKQIAVISAHNDAHIPFVEKHLQAPIVRIDPQAIARGTELSFYVSHNKNHIQYGSQNITHLHGIWLRKPQSSRSANLPVPDAYKQYSQSALEQLAAQLTTAFPHARWLSDLYAQQRASNKSMQLALAQTCDFNVMPTLFTSNAAAAQAFIAKHGSCITKPLSTQFPVLHGQQKAFMTTLVNTDNMPDLRGLRFAPAIFQKAIDVDIEVRATVVDRQVFAAKIQTKPAKSAHNIPVRDSRYAADGVQITSFKLPPDVVAQCIKHCMLLQMPFGAIDLLRDTAGLWWFLENNPNGQWAFVEDATGQPIGKAIASYLER